MHYSIGNFHRHYIIIVSFYLSRLCYVKSKQSKIVTQQHSFTNPRKTIKLFPSWSKKLQARNIALLTISVTATHYNFCIMQVRICSLTYNDIPFDRTLAFTPFYSSKIIFIPIMCSLCDYFDRRCCVSAEIVL